MVTVTPTDILRLLQWATIGVAAQSSMMTDSSIELGALREIAIELLTEANNGPSTGYRRNIVPEQGSSSTGAGGEQPHDTRLDREREVAAVWNRVVELPPDFQQPHDPVVRYAVSSPADAGIYDPNAGRVNVERGVEDWRRAEQQQTGTGTGS